eukprot:g39308.t1
MRGDLIEAYKILTGLDRVDAGRMFLMVLQAKSPIKIWCSSLFIQDIARKEGKLTPCFVDRNLEVLMDRMVARRGISLAELVLTGLNNFSFDYSHFLQTEVVAIGTRICPSYAYLF